MNPLLLDADVAACRVCGCTEDAACPGGCWWVPDRTMTGELCSSCVPTREDLVREVAHEHGLDGWSAAALLDFAFAVDLVVDPALLTWRPVETITVRDGLL